MEESVQIIAEVLLGVGAIVSLLNWFTLVETLRTGQFHSAIPLIGAIFLGVGALILPATRPYAWAAPLVDFGTLVLLFGLPTLARELWKTSRFNLLEESIGQVGNRTVFLRLFRRGVFTLVWQIQRSPGEYGWTQISREGEWRRDGVRLILQLGDECAIFEPLLLSMVIGWRQLVGFHRHEQDAQLSLAGIEFRVRYTRITGDDRAMV